MAQKDQKAETAKRRPKNPTLKSLLKELMKETLQMINNVISTVFEMFERSMNETNEDYHWLI